MKILVPVDGSALSLEAVRHVLALVRDGLKAEVVLANVQEPASLYEIVTVRDPALLQDVSAGAGAHLLEAAEALCRAAGVEFETAVASGDPAHALIDIVEEYGCGAIVIGAHGKGALASALLGSVSLAVVHASPVPVTLVKQAVVDQPATDDWAAAAPVELEDQPAAR